MKTSSCKAKGRALQNKVVELLRDKYCLPDKEGEFYFPLEKEIKPAIMGESGRDIKLTPVAESHIPFDIECKNTEKAAIWQWIAQAESNTEEGRIPLTIFKRNRSEIYCILKFSDLLGLI